MATRPKNFNLRHPERGLGEVFVGNLDNAQYTQLPYNTKRRGFTGFTAGGVRMRGILPAFVERSEIEQHPEGRELIWRLFQNGLWMIRYNHNRTHPELRPGEIFLSNVGADGFTKFRWSTKRLGETAYRTDGNRIGGARPVFVKRSELEGTPGGLSLLKMLLLEGIT
jgi:hypothetical protein